MTYHRVPKSAYYVYFARAGDMVKVGCSTRPATRLTEIGEWIPFKIELVATVKGAFDLESDLHAYFADSWSHLEWFRITPKIEAVIADVQRGVPLTIPKAPRDTGKELHKTLKKRASRRITEAEKRAGVVSYYPARHQQRPAYLRAAMRSFDGPHKAPPTAAALEAIARYEREMQARESDPA